MTDRKAKILQRLDERLGLPLNQAGWLLGLGRHKTKVAAAEGKIPVNRPEQFQCLGSNGNCSSATLSTSDNRRQSSERAPVQRRPFISVRVHHCQAMEIASANPGDHNPEARGGTV